MNLGAGLRALGLPAGDLLVHVSLRRLGPVAGGPAALLRALHEAAGPEGTIIVPTQTSHNSTTSPAFRAATEGLDDDQRNAYIASMPGFTPDMPSSGCGAFAEFVRRSPGAVRSAHPQTSFSAVGPRAAELMSVHDLDCHLGERSPLGRLYQDGAHALMIGCGWEACTALHLAEERVKQPQHKWYRCFVERDGRRATERFLGVDHDDRDFPQLGAAFERTGLAVSGRIGQSPVLIVPIRPAVDFAVGWLSENRTPGGESGT
ncbi:AAC(3) family N-acetyltransferase [Actinoplanes sp. NPDC089786]|uniref:aminoglycoside N(3)-acetyltransferase n=1 Tax=Actinoplanes sp. NPDC089786 TaxID=3155185 RepID=UPI003424321E